MSSNTRHTAASFSRTNGCCISAVIMLCLTVVFAACPVARAEDASLPESIDAGPLKPLPVQYNGRYMPIDTLARDVVQSVTGTQFFRDHDPVKMLLAWTFQPDVWIHEPLIPIGNEELRKTLQLAADREAFSYAELLRHGPLREEIGKLQNRSGNQKPDPLESKVGDISEKLTLLQRAFNNQLIRAVPVSDPDGQWMILDSAEGQIPELHQAKESWAALREAFLAGNNERFAEASETLINALQPLTPETAVSPDRIRTELFYNWLHPVRLSWIIMLIGCVFAFWSTVSDQKLARVLATAVLVAGFLMLTYGLYLRWQVAGRIPAANMYESLLFLGWGTGLFAIIAIPLLNDRVIPLTACMIGALSLLLADVLPLSPFVRPIPPVLRDTVWMTIHVPVIMVSYAVLSIAALVAHVQVVGLAIKPHDNKLAQRVDGLLYMYLLVGCFLLVIGICTGSMWASSSWGRYWGWDPKEVWSLIAFLGYLAILHVRADRGQPARWIQFVGWALASALILILTQRLEPLTVGKTLGLAGALVAGVVFLTTRGIFADALKSIIAFWMVIMTYVGVNFVLGMGLHSYGFGTGAVVKYLYLVGGIDLAILGVSSIAYLAARRATPAPAIEA